MNDIRKCLSYGDTLLCPRNSELEHLTDADLKVNCNGLDGVYPIINAPMDRVCSVPLINFLDKFGCPTTIHRWLKTPEEQFDFFVNCKIQNAVHCFLAVGIIAKWKSWIERLIYLREESGKPFSILVDVANGDTKSAIDTVKFIKDRVPSCKIMAGNVATKSGFRRLQEAGADFIRVGIGGGCFTSSMEVNTNCGKKKISEIQKEDFVYTHRGEAKEVIALIKYCFDGDIMEINDIECTKNHEFYVVPKKYKDVLTETNIHEYATWVRADELTDDYFLIKLEQ